jgi:hypothetical protein
MEEEIEMRGGVICTVMGGMLSSGLAMAELGGAESEEAKSGGV